MTQKQLVNKQVNGMKQNGQPEPEVVAKAKPRTFSNAYKLRILEEADGCNERGQVGALLRREGLYSSHLTTWRRQREAGKLSGKSSQRGRKKDKRATEIATLRRENERLQGKLAQAELIIAAQKKLAQALEQTLTRSEEEKS